MVVTLTDHIGTGKHGKKVDHGQWIVRVDDVQVGYLPKRPNAWLACIVSMDDETKQEVQKELSRLLDEQIAGVATVPEPDDDEPDDDNEDTEIE